MVSESWGRSHFLLGGWHKLTQNLHRIAISRRNMIFQSRPEKLLCLFHVGLSENRVSQNFSVDRMFARQMHVGAYPTPRLPWCQIAKFAPDPNHSLTAPPPKWLFYIVLPKLFRDLVWWNQFIKSILHISVEMPMISLVVVVVVAV